MTITIVNGASAPVTTYQDGPGNPTQGGMCWASNSSAWWWFQINSANDATGNPGTHKVSAWYNTSSDPAFGSWTYYGDSPNLDSTAASGNSNLKFRNGRSMGAINFANSTVDVCQLACGIFMASGVPAAANAIWGNLRIVLGSNTLTWGTFGVYITDNFNYADTNLFAAFALGRDTNGHIHVGSNILTDQLDAGVAVSQDADTGATWTTGGRGTANNASGSAVLTSLSNETGMGVSYACTNDLLAPAPGGSTNIIKSIDSGTQITLQLALASGGATGTRVGWTNFTAGSAFTRHQAGGTGDLIADSSMTKECNAYGFAPLASGAMLMIYDNGALAAPNLQQLSSIRGNGTYANGVWPNATGPDASVFATNVTIRDNDWCSCGVSTTAIYCARWQSTTTCIMRNYVVASNNWQAMTNAIPTMTGKTIVVGGGVCLVTDGTDMWLVVIDSTDAQIKYVKYTHGSTNINGTWGSWTNLVAVGSTAAFLTCTIANGYLVAAWSEKNADTTHYDTLVASLSVGTHAIGPTGDVNQLGNTLAISTPVAVGWT